MRKLLILLALPLLLGAQYAKPTGTDQGTDWTTCTGTCTEQCAEIGNGDSGLATSGGDGTYITEDTDTNVQACALTTLSTPDTGTHYLRCRVSIVSNKAHTLTVRLCSNATCTDTYDPRATLVVTTATTAAASFETSSVTLTDINYSSLYMDMKATATSPTDVNLLDCEYEVPDAPSGGRRRVIIAG